MGFRSTNRRFLNQKLSKSLNLITNHVKNANKQATAPFGRSCWALTERAGAAGEKVAADALWGLWELVAGFFYSVHVKERYAASLSMPRGVMCMTILQPVLSPNKQEV
jgi:hypothetical protein